VAVITFGLQTGWISPLQPALQSNDSPLGESAEPLTDDEISWIGALPSLTLVLSAPIFGYCLDRFGRKFTLLLTTVPNIVTYLLLIFANHVNVIYASRLIGGFCSCGGFIVAPIYISETAMPNFRGKLCGLIGFFATLGMILSFIFGSYTSYLTLNLMSVSFTLVFIFGYYFMPESPVYLIKNGKIKEAERNYKKLWGKHNADLISEEIQICRTTTQDEESTSTFEFFKQFLTQRHLRKAFLIVMGIFGFQMLSGYPVIIRYTVDIFQRAGTTYSPYMAAIFVAISQLIFSLVGALLIDRIGRKSFVVYALAVMGFLLATLSLYLYLKPNYPDHYLIYFFRYLPSICLISFIGVFAAAFCTVSFVIIPELFSPETRAFASSSLNLWFAFTEFVVIKVFPSLTSAFNLSGALAVLAGVGFLGALYLQILMFETKGLDFDIIQRKLKGENIHFIEKEKVALKKSEGDAENGC